MFAHKHSILDAWRCFEYACAQIAPNNVLCHHNKRLIKYFKLLYGSGIICLPLIFQKNCIDNISSKSQKRKGLIVFILDNTMQYLRTLKSNIYYSSKRLPLPLFHLDTNSVFCHVLIHSFDKTHVLVVTVESIWLLLLNILSFNFVLIPNKLLLGWQDSEEAM